MLQAEYSKLAVTLNPESSHYIALEEAFAFLCPPLNTADGTEDYYHEQRLAYVKEMIPVMKKVGEKTPATSLVALPYLQKFQASEVESGSPSSPSILVTALIEEMFQLAITEGVRVRLEKQIISDPAKFKVLKHAEEMMVQREVETGELVKKHYRKRSIKLHPDRNGEEMRPIFEEFTDARTVLSNTKLRQSYLRGMLDVFKYYGTSMMAESHESWNKKHRPDKAEGDAPRGRRGKGDDNGDGNGNGKTLKLEGGLHQQLPKGVILHHRRDGKKNHVVSVSISVLRPLHDFYARVRSVRVEMKDTSDEKIVVELGRDDIVKKIECDRQGPILANEISVVEMTLNPGHWEVHWSATLDTVGTDPLNPKNATKNESVTTRSSAKATFHVVDYDELRKFQDFVMAENVCKVIKGELANTLHKLRTNQSDSTSMTSSARFGHYHQILVRARKKCYNLSRAMGVTGKSSSVYDSLSSLLAESRQVFAELEEKVEGAKKRKEKRDDVKHFKAYIAGVLESDDPMKWMMQVTEEELCCEGGDVNRLYQLFIEGKGKYVLMVDSEMYKEASLREDIFSTKQCKDLASRGEEVAILEAKEEEEAAAAEAKRKLEEEEREKMRKEAELRDKWAMVGQNATISGLTSEKGKPLNHQMARIMYYSVDKDRFEVQLYNNSEEKAYLRKDNLTVYYGHVPNPKQQQQQSPNKRKVVRQPPSVVAAPNANIWNCEKCTFENDDVSTECSMCINPRSKKSSEKQQGPVVEPSERQQEPVGEKNHEKKEPDAKKGPIKATATISTEKKADKLSVPVTNTSDSAQLKKTIYVRSSHSKKLTGKRGRKKKDLVSKSGADDIHIETSAIGTQVPVYLTGSREAVWKAIALIQEAIGMENVSEKLDKPAPPPAAPTPVVVSPSIVKAPAPIAPAPLEKVPVTNTQQSNTGFVNSGLFSGFGKPLDTVTNGVHVSVSGSETQPSSQYSFGDAFLPRGLMDLSVSTINNAEVPSEIGINSQGMTRETITEASISSLNDRSNVSKTYSNFTLNENDPLLVFLRAQHQCMKGSVDEFYIWLVKSEDIDSMSALKEAVSDDDYLNDSMKVGNGSSGLKGFKRKTFQRAVLEYDDTTPTKTLLSQPLKPPSNDPSAMNGMNGNAFLPSNLFSGNDDPNPFPVVSTSFSDPPEELFCPIGLVLMTVDPVLAADGITYERSCIENWFQKTNYRIQMAQENLKWNPLSERDQKVVENGIRSPAYGTMMMNLVLTPNTSVRNMARAYKERKDAARF